MQWEGTRGDAAGVGSSSSQRWHRLCRRRSVSLHPRGLIPLWEGAFFILFFFEKRLNVECGALGHRSSSGRLGESPGERLSLIQVWAVCRWWSLTPSHQWPAPEQQEHDSDSGGAYLGCFESSTPTRNWGGSPAGRAPGPAGGPAEPNLKERARVPPSRTKKPARARPGGGTVTARLGSDARRGRRGLTRHPALKRALPPGPLCAQRIEMRRAGESTAPGLAGPGCSGPGRARVHTDEPAPPVWPSDRTPGPLGLSAPRRGIAVRALFLGPGPAVMPALSPVRCGSMPSRCNSDALPTAGRSESRRCGGPAAVRGLVLEHSGTFWNILGFRVTNPCGHSPSRRGSRSVRPARR